MEKKKDYYEIQKQFYSLIDQNVLNELNFEEARKFLDFEKVINISKYKKLTCIR